MGIIGIIGAGVIFFSLWIGGAFAGGFSGGVAGFFAGLGVGGLALIVALITLAVGFGLLSGRGWAWTLAVVISVINAIVGILQVAGVAISTLRIGVLGYGDFGGAITLVISLVALFYLYRPNVKAFFGKL